MNEPQVEHHQWGQANADVVIEFVEHLTAAWEAFTRDRRTGKEVAYVDGFMTAHNFHRLIVFDMIERLGLEGGARAAFLRSARDTWDETMNAAGALRVAEVPEEGTDAGRST